MAHLQRSLGGSICELCLHAAYAGSEVVFDMSLADGEVHFCRDHLRFDAPEGRGEVLYERIVDHRRQWISIKPTARVMYRNPLVGGNAEEGTIEAIFASSEDRDAFLAELSEIMAG